MINYIKFKYGKRIETIKVVKKLDYSLAYYSKENLIKLREDAYKRNGWRVIRDIIPHEIYHKDNKLIKFFDNLRSLLPLFLMLTLILFITNHHKWWVYFLFLAFYIYEVSVEFLADSYACKVIGTKKYLKSLKIFDKNECYTATRLCPYLIRWFTHLPPLRYWIIKKRIIMESKHN